MVDPVMSNETYIRCERDQLLQLLKDARHLITRLTPFSVEEADQILVDAIDSVAANADAMGTRIDAELASAITPTPQTSFRIKPLEWKASYSDEIVQIQNVWPLPFYQVRVLEGVVWLDAHNSKAVYPSVDEAKSAAQLDYETRILAAFISPPAICQTCDGTGKEGRHSICRDCDDTPKPQASSGPSPVLKGVGKRAGDGWKDTTKKGEIVFVWNREHPSPYTAGQFPRIGKERWSASTEQYDFSPATLEEIEALFSNRTLATGMVGHKTPEYGVAQAAFADYFLRNYPSDTVIFDPNWHAPKLFYAAFRTLDAVAQPAGTVAADQNAAATSRPPETFQARVEPWLLECFGQMIAGDREERNHRFLEEALELVQSLGCTAHEAHQLVDYVYGRSIGEPHQEVGGTMVTLAALCWANALDMHEAGETELARIWTKVDAIRTKQAAKPKHSPLPGPTVEVKS